MRKRRSRKHYQQRKHQQQSSDWRVVKRRARSIAAAAAARRRRTRNAIGIEAHESANVIETATMTTAIAMVHDTNEVRRSTRAIAHHRHHARAPVATLSNQQASPGPSANQHAIGTVMAMMIAVAAAEVTAITIEEREGVIDMQETQATSDETRRVVSITVAATPMSVISVATTAITEDATTRMSQMRPTVNAIDGAIENNHADEGTIPTMTTSDRSKMHVVSRARSVMRAYGASHAQLQRVVSQQEKK
jgi:hypothetical protein